MLERSREPSGGGSPPSCVGAHLAGSNREGHAGDDHCCSTVVGGCHGGAVPHRSQLCLGSLRRGRSASIGRWSLRTSTGISRGTLSVVPSCGFLRLHLKAEKTCHVLCCQSAGKASVSAPDRALTGMGCRWGAGGTVMCVRVRMFQVWGHRASPPHLLPQWGRGSWQALHG